MQVFGLSSVDCIYACTLVCLCVQHVCIYLSSTENIRRDFSGIDWKDHHYYKKLSKMNFLRGN